MVILNPRKSLRLEIILCILMAVVPSFAILFIAIQHVQQDLQKELIERAEAAQKTVATNLEYIIKDFKSNVANQSKEEVILELLDTKGQKKKDVLKIIQYLKKTADVKEVTVYNADGMMIASTGTDKKQEQLDSALLNSIEKKKKEMIPAVVNLSLDRERGFQIDAYAPIVEPVNKYVLGILHEIRFIDREYIETMKRMTGLEVCLFDHKNMPVVSSFPAMPVVNPLNSMNHQDSYSIGNIPYYVVLTPILKEDGKPLGSVGLFSSKKIIEQNIMRVRWILILALLVIIVFCFALAIYSTKNVVNPIFAVVASLRKIAMGDFSQNIEVKKQNEIGELGSAFNAMSTRLKHSIKELERSEQRYHNLIEFADVGIIVANDDKMIQVNKKAEEIYGYSKNELIGLSPRVLTLEQYAKQHSEIFKEMLTNGKPKKTFVEEEGLRKDGSTVPLEISYALSESADDGKYNVVAIMRDITERKLHQEELQKSYNEMELRVRERTEELKQAKEAAESANRAKSDFLANMSHELRTPLNHIIGFTELIADEKFGELNETQSEYLNDVLTSSRHLLSLINDILDLSKVESGKMEVAPSDINPRALLDNSLIMFKEKSLKHRIQLATDVDHVPKTIKADERKLKQVIYNLLSNAMKFTPDGGTVLLSARMVDCFIRSGLRWGDPEDLQIIEDQINVDESTGAGCKRCVEFCVSDTGIGIKPEDQERIFAPFEQVEGSASRKYQGTGLGLSLTKRLVELHGGKIWVESEGEGQGATFRFTIPV